MGMAGRHWLAGLTLLLTGGGVTQTFALTQEQAIEDCRNSVGRPIVQQCMHGDKGLRESCREQAKPQVRACVIKAMNAANGRANVPVAVPTEKGPDAETEKQAEALPARFVAPPRTIRDITAILDSEKPDPAKIAVLKTEADAEITNRGSQTDLARAYYKRGNA